MARDNIRHADSVDIQLKLIHKCTLDGRTHNLPSASKVATLIVGDIKSIAEAQDIIVEGCDGRLKRISELQPCYLAFQYPLLFPCGEDGYRLDISHKGLELDVNSLDAELIPTYVKKCVRLTMREWFPYRIMDRIVRMKLTPFYVLVNCSTSFWLMDGQ